MSIRGPDSNLPDFERNANEPQAASGKTWGPASTRISNDAAQVCAKSRYRQPTPPTLLATLRSSKLPPPIPTSTFTSHEDLKNRDLGYIPLGGDSTKNSRRRVRSRHGSNCFFDEGNKFHDFEDTESSPDQYLETEIRVGTPLSFTGEGFQAST